MSVSPYIRFGTSTWTYEGWQGLVYTKTYPKGRFKQDCLEEYASYHYRGEPLFRSVGFDFTFYGPPTVRQLEHYAAQLPPDFRVCSKVWEEVTVPAFSTGLRYRSKTGPNPHFLDVEYFKEQVLAPFEQAFRRYTGPFIFEFQRTGFDDSFLQQLDSFLAKLPRDHQYAVEVRNPPLLGSEYRSILQAHGVAHVYNHLAGMPPLWEQFLLLGGEFTAPLTVLRLLTPRDMSYAEAVRAYRPYNMIKRAIPEMRHDTVRLMREAMSRKLPAYVLVNNRSEGSAPLTVQALADELMR